MPSLRPSKATDEAADGQAEVLPNGENRADWKGIMSDPAWPCCSKPTPLPCCWHPYPKRRTEYANLFYGFSEKSNIHKTL